MIRVSEGELTKHTETAGVIFTGFSFGAIRNTQTHNNNNNNNDNDDGDEEETKKPQDCNKPFPAKKATTKQTHEQANKQTEQHKTTSQERKIRK